jgi:hypothetical protein
MLEILARAEPAQKERPHDQHRDKNPEPVVRSEIIGKSHETGDEMTHIGTFVNARGRRGLAPTTTLACNVCGLAPVEI